MLAELIMKVYRELYGEGGGGGGGRNRSSRLVQYTRDPQQSQRRVGGGGRGQLVHVNIRRGPTLG